MAVSRNKAEGAFFERILEHMAATQGVLAQKQPLAFRYLRGGKVLPIRTELDFSLINRQGRIAFVDTKLFAGDYFTFSQLDPTQLRRATRYNEWGIPSGFVVRHAGSNEVAYYSGEVVASHGPRTRFAPAMGVRLGTLLHFAVAPIFEALPVPKPLPRLHL